MKEFVIYYKQIFTGCLSVSAENKEKAQEIAASIVTSAEAGALPDQTSELEIITVERIGEDKE